ncbi:MAG: class I SAM-dependent DNA methyltransferase [Fusobacteriota bacterium]
MYTGFAKIYDRVMTNLNYDNWYKFLKNILKEINFTGTDIMDLGCGTGEIAIRFKKDGFKVMGVDISEDMLERAEDKINDLGLHIPLTNQDMRKLRLPIEVDAVVAIFDTINHLLDEEELEKTFESIYLHLPKKGYFIFDMATRKLMDDMFEKNSYIEERDDMFINWNHYYDKKSKTDRIRTLFFVKQPNGLYEKIEEIHEKRIFKENTVEKVAKKIGFKVEKKYKNKEFAGERVFYVLKKE